MREETVALLIACILLLPGCVASEGGVDLFGVEYREPPEAPDFTLFDQDGELFTLSEYEGKVVVVAFVYTSCPDICLVISANLDYIGQNLDDYSDEVVIISVTIDPARDTINHLAEWTDLMGYDWHHLTGPTSTLQDTYRLWNVIVDNEHINASQPPEEESNRIAVLYPDNSTFHHGENGVGLSGSDFATRVFNESNISYDMAEGIIGDWQSDGEWTWVLHAWDVENESWAVTQESVSSIILSASTHLAWAASNADLDNLPPGVDCDGRGWVMGSGGGAHCMCDDGYERPDGDWLSCIAEGTGSNDGGAGANPHEESFGEYEVGHSTVTFILDKQLHKRVAYSGINWEADEFLHDLKALVDE